MPSKQYWYLLWLSLLLTLLAVWTVLPLPGSKINALGFYSHCPFAPWSTALLLILAGAGCILRSEFKKRRGRD